jgi:hypothetical protein
MSHFRNGMTTLQRTRRRLYSLKPVPPPFPRGDGGRDAMLYDAYEIQRSMLAGASAMANFSAGLLNNPANPFAYFGGGPVIASALEVFAHASAPRGKPDFGLDHHRDRRQADRSARRDRAAQAVRPAQALRARGRRGRPQAADRRADVRPLRHAAARHGGADAALRRRLHHRLARREAGAAVRRPLRPRRLYRLYRRVSGAYRRRKAIPGRTCWRCASLRCPATPPRR